MQYETRSRIRGAFRWVAGSALATGIIVATGIFYSGGLATNPAGWVMTVVMATMVGLMIALPPLDESWQTAPVRKAMKTEAVLWSHRNTPIHFPAVHMDSGRIMTGGNWEKAASQADYLRFAADNPVCHLGTVCHGLPRVQTVLMWRADSEGLYFALLSPQGICQDLKENPQVDVCFYNNPDNLAEAIQLRVSGNMNRIENTNLRHQAAEARVYWTEILGYPVEPYLEIFKLSLDEAHFWTMHRAMEKHTMEAMAL
ncbi:MAG: pyridoxamine 5'-phosphate oxidase family protein [Puniceicoccaceae bacterium]